MLQTLHRKDCADFHARVAERVAPLYAAAFGSEYPVTSGAVHQMQVQCCIWLEADDKTVAATMISTRYRDPTRFRIEGIAVDEAHRRRGLATRLIKAVDEFMGSVAEGSTIELGVDLDTDDTDWLVQLYERHGYKVWRQDEDEILMRKC